MEVAQDALYQQNLQQTKSIAKDLTRAGVEVDCYSCRGTEGSNGKATEDCDIAIDFREGGRSTVEKTMSDKGLNYRVEEIPDYLHGIMRLKIDL